MIHRLFFVFVAALSMPSVLLAAEANDLTQYVDPMIGSGGHGHVFVGANVPFGAVQLGPSNFFQGWDWCSGYHYSDDVVQGFSHLHLSGTGIPDLGDVLIMPYTGEITSVPGSRSNPETGFASRYSHEQESVSPGRYTVKLLDYDIQVDLTATERVGLHRYRFPDNTTPRIAVDLIFENKENGGATKTAFKQVDDHTIVGLRFSTSWARDQRVYFTIKSSVPIKTCDLFAKDRKLDDSAEPEEANVAVLSFAEGTGEVMLKVGISPVSEENALANIKAEIPDWDFERVAQEATAKWNKELGVLRIKTEDESTKKVFYTALYHTMIAPALFNDHNGDYRGADREVHHSDSFDNYTVFSLWDTYRAAHPLYTITQPKRINDFVNSMLAIYDQQGKLPVWHLVGSETDTMVGYHAVPVIVDAYLKGFRGFDVEKAYEAVKHSAMLDDRGLKHLKARGYIPSDKEVESVAKAMEYAIDDWCIAQMAKSLGHDEDYVYFMKRAAGYQQYFDSETGFMRGKLEDGSWREPFDPFSSKHRQDDYCEGNAWQYLWLVPQDVEGLISLLDGDEKFISRLDDLFGQEEHRTAETSPDMTGLVGQYVHGNEPSHHIIYLYAYAGQQWKSAKWARYVLKNLYNDRPDGICGNEDCGQISSWYLLSAMGLYPVNPAAGIYVIGSPAVDEVEISVADGKSFTIVAENNSSENIYVQSACLNGQPYTKSYLRHQDIAAGGKLILKMGPEPNKEFGQLPQDRPQSKPYVSE